MRLLENRRVLLIVGGGIAAYKAPLIVRACVASGATVRCVLTPAATSFVTPMTLQAVSGHKVAVELLDAATEAEIGHIELARWPDIVLIAPATANLIARMAAGMANDLATTVLLATQAPCVVAPAMNSQMLSHPATRRNLATLAESGHTLVTPDSGELACGELGPGRQPDAEVLVEALARRLAPTPLRGQRLVVTAGPTRAHLDPVRFISNPSSGRMGVALARAAWWLGADVTLIAGPGVAVPAVLALDEVVHVESAQEMADAVLTRLETADWLFMAAAVGDWQLLEPLTEKRKKSTADTDETWTLVLSRTVDILRAAVLARATRARRERALHIVGFAAETHEMERHARSKLEKKGCDVVLGNWVRSAQGDTFGSDQVALSAFGRGWEEAYGPGDKLAVALEVLGALSARFADQEDA